MSLVDVEIAAKTDATGVGGERKQDFHKRNMATSVQTFKTAVLRIRDTLRSPGVGITGMDSMRHICLYLMSRYMTRAKAASLGVPDAFAWETLLEAARTKNGGVQEAFDCFYHPQEDCLVRHFDRLFGTDKFSFDIKSPQKHKEILEILDAVDMTEVDDEMDILGWVYEQHLRTGSSAARDLGQFFSDRALCQYMTDLCKPGFKSAGVPESICDPAMGTAGFLTAFIKHFKKHHADKPIDWSVQQKEIYGCDTDPKVAGVARLNLFMEMGGNRAMNLWTRDSLYGGLPQTFDVILANMPFGLKGIKYADCCERVKALTIRGTKSEPLFLQLMMVSLNVGGRCAVVVPDGMLINRSSCHDGTRKHLLDHFELRRVIKMKGKFFMNTSIRSSVLFFEKTGKPTEAVEFWEAEKGEKGEIVETMIMSVPRAKMDASCSLDVRSHLDADKAMSTAHTYPMVRLGDLYEVGKLSKTFNSKDVDNQGDVPFFNGKWNCPVGTHSEHSFERDGDYFVMIRGGGGDHSSDTVGMGKFFMVRGKCAVTSCNAVLVPKTGSTAKHKYIHYAVSHNVKALRDKAKYSTNLGHITLQDVLDFAVPLPPLPIQQEIVQSLDRIYNPEWMARADARTMTGKPTKPIVGLLHQSTQLVADVRAYMASIAKASSRTAPRLALGDVCAVAFGERITQREHEGTMYPVYGGGESTFRTNRFNREGATCKVARFAVSEKTMVLMIRGKYWCLDSGFTVSSKDKDRVLDEYMWWVLWANQSTIATCSTGSCQKNINMDMFYSLQFGFPPLDVQKRVVEKMKMLESQVEALQGLRDQLGDNARFILESHLGFSR
ncbi:hypothetical protein EBZ80_13260 [bacterium]|nr:hypothetical protein [bacterium]